MFSLCQVYFQRVLSSKSAATAEIISYLAAFGCIIMAVPPVLIGGIAKATSWNETDYFTKYNGTVPIPKDDTRMILPMVLKYLTPRFVTKALMALDVIWEGRNVKTQSGSIMSNKRLLSDSILASCLSLAWEQCLPL